MKKYGILSLNIYEKDNNWGSILQSYALQECVKSMGYGVYIIDICPEYINKYEAKYPIVRAFPFNFRLLIHSIRNSIIHYHTYIRRANKFKRFIEKYYNKTAMLTVDTLKKEKFDGYIVGSDIVWNIDFTCGFNDLYFCNYDFMKNKNNIAYAPSMCDRRLNLKEIEDLKIRLKNFRYLSVREVSMANYLAELTEKSITDALDPTLLIPKSAYEKILEKRLVEDDYILVYTVPPDESLAIYASKYAEDHGLKMVRIECLNIQNKLYDCIEYSDAGIEEWLSLIKYAKLVVTNSFHACIFSIIFKTQFHAVYRNPGKTKIEDLCKLLGIKNYCEKSSDYSFNMDSEIDFCAVEERLNTKRKESLSYLKNALNEVLK